LKSGLPNSARTSLKDAKFPPFAANSDGGRAKTLACAPIQPPARPFAVTFRQAFEK
jgi:hypothetical protein